MYSKCISIDLWPGYVFLLMQNISKYNKILYLLICNAKRDFLQSLDPRARILQEKSELYQLHVHYREIVAKQISWNVEQVLFFSILTPHSLSNTTFILSWYLLLYTSRRYRATTYLVNVYWQFKLYEQNVEERSENLHNGMDALYL